MLTATEIYKEYANCLVDPIYVIETYFKTFDKTRNGYVPFKLFRKQKEIVKSLKDHRFNIVAKPRQAGVSTTVAASSSVLLGFADENNPEAILIVANKQDMAFEFLAKIKYFLDQLPRWVWGPDYYGTPEKEKKSIFSSDSKKEIKLPNGCRVKAVATSPDALRGYTPTVLIMDEAAFIDDGKDLFGAALTALGTGGRAILISTPNSLDELYYETYDLALKKQNNFNIIEMRWYQDDRYNIGLKWYKYTDKDKKNKEVIDEEDFTFESYDKKLKDGYKPTSPWYEEMCRGMNNDPRMIAQELDVSFLGSGGNVISDEYIEHHKNKNVKDPVFLSGRESELWIWEQPIEGHEYILGCLPPNEKVLTDRGLINIEDVELNDKLVCENGDYVNIINKQIYPVVNEDVYDIKVDNTFRRTRFTKEHPILISKPVLKRNYDKQHNIYRFNERYWDFDFKYKKVGEIEVGDWVKVPNIYDKKLDGALDDKWTISANTRYDFDIKSPLNNPEFWWFIGLWLGDGWLSQRNHHYSISVCFNSNDEYYLDKLDNLIDRLFNRKASFVDKQNNTYNLIFTSKFLYHFLLENFGRYSHGKKISEWVKYIDKKHKIELIKGYLASDGCWLKTDKKGKTNSKVSFTSVNLELLESFQDIIFSLGIVSSLNKLRSAKKHIIGGRTVSVKQAYSLTLANQDSLDLINLLNNDPLDPKLNKFDINQFETKNNRIISSCHFSKDKKFIYFRVKDIVKETFTGNVYNFECDTHTFMCHHITTHNCDVSRGDGEDYSTFTVIDFTTMTQVAEYMGRIPPDKLADILFEYGTLYNALLVVDITGGMGVATILKLQDMKYPNLYYGEKGGQALKKRKDMHKYNSENEIAGFQVGSDRTRLVSTFEKMVRINKDEGDNHGIKIRSARLISELHSFVYINGRADHAKNKHDDLIMAMAMALFVLEHSFKQLKANETRTKAMLASWVSFSMAGDVKSTEAPVRKESKKPNFSPMVAKNMQDPTGEYMWLFGGFNNYI